MAAQTLPAAPSPPDQGDDENEIVVTGQRERGAVPGDIKPELQLRPADIRAYGVSSVADLINELAPQTRSDRSRGGAPVVLLNGRRISGFAEIRDLPTEAIARVDILPEETALQYGYPATQRVVNIVLRRRFRSITAELSDALPTAGGANAPQIEATLVRIRQDQRFNLDLKYQQRDALFESDRDVRTEAGAQHFSLAGNVLGATPGGEIDPSLSALVGHPVSIAGVPAGAANAPPLLGDFVATADQPGTTNIGRYRTLTAATKAFTANASIARNIFGTVSATLNGELDITHSDGLRGLAGAILDLPAGNGFSPFGSDVRLARYLDPRAPLAQSTDGVTGHLGFALNGNAGTSWRWSVTGGYDHNESRSRSDRGFDPAGINAALAANDPGLNPFGTLPPSLLVPLARNRARSISNGGNVDAVISGTIAQVPAGKVTTSLMLGTSLNRLDSSAFRGGTASAISLSRNTADARLSVNVPLTSRSNDVLGMLGDLGVNANVAVQHISDQGTLTTLGYGFNWKPIEPLTLIVSAIDDKVAPTATQLNDSPLLTANTQLFDYVRGTTAQVTTITGGNPLLRTAKEHSLKIEATWKPFEKTDLQVTANYLRSRSSDPIGSLAAPTAALQAAFPDRFVRDPAGELVQVDLRPVNFASERSDELRWGINFSKPLKSKRTLTPDAWRAMMGRRSDGGNGPGAEGRSGGAGRGGGGGGGRGSGGAQGGRLQFAVYHTWHFSDTIQPVANGPVLDLLNGAASGQTGGQPRHEIETQAGYSRDGFIARLSANWQSGTHVDGAGGQPESALRFSDLATINLRLAANLGQQPDLVRDHPWLRGTRITLAMNNLFDAHLHVRDASGAIPISYQPAYLDPIGRSVRLSIRKMFF